MSEYIVRNDRSESAVKDMNLPPVLVVPRSVPLERYVGYLSREVQVVHDEPIPMMPLPIAKTPPRNRKERRQASATRRRQP